MIAASLTEIANFYGTDKGTVGPSKQWGAMNYTDVYEAYLTPYRNSPITILEIGLGVQGETWKANIVHGRNEGGASLKMWYDYLPNASIYGIDVNPCPNLNNDRITTFVADQSDIQQLESFIQATNNTEFDVIIDDGSHRPDHQQISLEFFFQKLKNGGIYFIEDLASNGTEDSTNTRSTCNYVKNTRNVLKHLKKHGTPAEPNAFQDSAYLIEHIAYLNFHAPNHIVDISPQRSLRHPFKTTVHHEPDTELLCAIGKK